MDAKTLDAIVKDHLHFGTYHGAGPYSASQFLRCSPGDTGGWDRLFGYSDSFGIFYKLPGCNVIIDAASSSNTECLHSAETDNLSKAVVHLSTLVQKQKKKIGEKKECTSSGFSLLGFQLVAPSYVVSDVYETRISPLYFPRVDVTRYSSDAFSSEGKEKDIAYTCTFIARDNREDKRGGVFTSYTCVVPENIVKEIQKEPSLMLKLFERASPQYFEKQGKDNLVRPFEKVKDYVVEDHRLTKPVVVK